MVINTTVMLQQCALREALFRLMSSVWQERSLQFLSLTTGADVISVFHLPRAARVDKIFLSFFYHLKLWVIFQQVPNVFESHGCCIKTFQCYEIKVSGLLTWSDRHKWRTDGSTFPEANGIV